MKLAELQARFQAAVLAGDDHDASMLKAITPSDREDGSILFGVYVNAYRLRLEEFLKEDHPCLRALMGEDIFDALTQDYIEATPSRFRNARWYSSQLPDFMRSSERWRSEERAISLAKFERALTDAFDAADAEPLLIGALASFPSERWPSLIFDLHPSLSIIEVQEGTVETYGALRLENQQDLPFAREGAEKAAVWRSRGESVYRLLEADEFVALNEARAGRAFGGICQMAAFQQGDAATPARLAQFLVTWFEQGLVVAVRDDGAE